jgi:hypothetical protein
MSKPTDIRIVEASLKFEPVPYRVPLKFGGRVVEKSELISVEVIVESRNGKLATGLGSMPVGNVWAWPSEKMTPEQTQDVLKKYAEEVIELANGYPDFGHPLEISYQLSGEYFHLGKTLAQKLKLPEEIPVLAQLVAASPFDAALHDGYGCARNHRYDGCRRNS